MIHMLGGSEVRLLQVLQKEEKIAVSRLSEKMGLSLSTASELVASLRRKGFVEVERRGKKRLVSFASAKHAQLMKDLLGRFDYMDFSHLLSGKAFDVLYVLDRERSAGEIASAIRAYRASVYRVLGRLMERGVVRKRDARYSLNPGFAGLSEVSKEAVSYHHRKKALELSPSAVIVWEGLREFIARAPSARGVRGFHLTGPSRLGDYGIPLLSTGSDYYFYSEEKDGVDLYDVVVHTLLIDPRSTRYITYLLILLAKAGVDERSLLERAEAYGVAREARSLLGFLNTRGRVRGEHFPTWGEFSEKAKGYGVEV
jgi:predicted transcriptional regulator